MLRAIAMLIKLPFVLVIAIGLAIWQTFILPFTGARDVRKQDVATGMAPSYFRNLRDLMGNIEIEGIENLSDREISSIYASISKQMTMQALVRRERVSEGLINGVVRDCLMVYASSGSDQGLSYERQVLDAYTAHGAEAVKVKGRLYA